LSTSGDRKATIQGSRCLAIHALPNESPGATSFVEAFEYDAITVTKQSDIYREVLQHGTDDAVGEFNAFNGEWLLKMVTANTKIRREREGIIGAWKLISALISKSDITWVPLSVAEMIRVSGNIGLRMSDGDFSRYHTVTTWHCDLREADLPKESYDVVLAAAVLHHLRDDEAWRAAFKKVISVLRPGGSFAARKPAEFADWPATAIVSL